MATIPELLDGHVTLEVECLDRLYLNGYIGKLATGPGLVFFMREQLGKPVASPVVLGQISEKFREAVKALAEREEIPVYQFRHKENLYNPAEELRMGFLSNLKKILNVSEAVAPSVVSSINPAAGAITGLIINS